MGRRRRSGMHAGTRGGSDFGPGRAGGERTRNMPFMSVTLDVSKLSGWLNADADCRVEIGAMKRSQVRARGSEGGEG